MTREPPLAILDERSRPPLRARVGQLLGCAEEAAFAVRRIRLAVLDLTDQEIGHLHRCRVLLGHLDATTLMDASEAAGPGGRGPALDRLLRWAASGRLEVRSAGLAAWTPDFGVVTGPSARTGLMGSIQFGNPELVTGPALTVVTTDASAAAMLLERFDELWDRSHDVLPAIQAVLERAHAMGAAVATGRGGAHVE
jgi:hypothetical protein